MLDNYNYAKTFKNVIFATDDLIVKWMKNPITYRYQLITIRKQKINLNNNLINNIKFFFIMNNFVFIKKS